MGPSVGVIWDSCFLNHDAGVGHPERPERLVAIREVLQDLELWTKLQSLDVREATTEELVRNHTKELVQHVLEADGKAHTYFDADTQASPGTTKAALRAAGGAIDIARAVWRGDVARGFSLGRPPGHHAEHSAAMGFCYFNNIAVAARALMEDDGLERILIVDWDVHHGNGTQHSFEDDPRVLFVSTHQYPFYPGTGSLDEIGVGAGKGFNVNLPLLGGQGDDDYLFLFERVLRPLVQQFSPQMIMLSAGYDAHARDPLGGMKISTQGFAALAKELCALADEHCAGKLVAMLEGGYDLQGLSTSVGATMQVMLGEQVECSGDAAQAGPMVKKLLASLEQQFSGIWSFS